MKLKLLLVGLFLSVCGPALADQTMTDLKTAAQRIEAQLSLANSLSISLNTYGQSASIVSDGSVDPALIDQQMVEAYNNAIDTVLNTSYLTAQDVLVDKHTVAVSNLQTAINDLVSATSVLATVSTVAEMASDANTTQDQLQVQQALATTDMSITTADVDNFNNALGAVESYAQQAGAYLAASQDTNITSAVDNYAAANNVAVASLTAVTYTQNIDRLVFEFGNAAYLEFNGSFTEQTISTSDIWGEVNYVAPGGT